MQGQITKAFQTLRLENKELKDQLKQANVRAKVEADRADFYQAHYSRKLAVTHDYGRCVPAKDLIGKSVVDLLIGMAIVELFQAMRS